MRPNPIFAFLKKACPTKQAFELKKDKEGRQYFLKSLIIPKGKIKLEEQKAWSISEQHLSIYEKYNDRYPYVTAYHFTMTLIHPDKTEPIKVHCYFDTQSIFKAVTIKEGQEYREVSVSLIARLKNHAELYALATFTALNDRLEKKREVLRKQIHEKEQYIEELSKNIEKNLQSYIEHIEALIPFLQEIGDLREYTGPKIKIYQRILELCAQKQKQIKATKEISESAEISRSTGSTDTYPEKELEEHESEESQVIASREAKLVPLSEENIDELIESLNQMNTIQTVDRDKIIAEAMKGDEEAIQKIIDYGCFLKPYHYFRMVVEGNEKFFKKAYERFPINLNLRFLLDNEESSSCLEAAYGKRNWSLFKYLLQIGANPNVANGLGRRLIHQIAADGEVAYAKYLLEFHPETDISSFYNPDPFNIDNRISLSSKSKIKKIKEIKKSIPEYQAQLIKDQQNNSRTPLMEAVYCSQEEMVDLLLEFKADPLLEAKQSDMGPMALATSCREFGGKKVKKLNPHIIFALVKKGGNVDVLFGDKDKGSLQMTGLYYACQEGDLDAVKILVECFGADTNFAPLEKNRLSFVPTLQSSPLLVALSAVHKDPIVYLDIVQYLLLEQDFVLIKMKTLNEILSLKTALDLPKQAVRNIEKSKEKLTLLVNASRAFNKKDYKTATACAEKGLSLSLTLRTEMNTYNTQQHNEQLFNVLYLSHYVLKDYKNARTPCLKYIASLQTKLQRNLDPHIQTKLQTALTKAEAHLGVISAVLSEMPASPFWQPPLTLSEAKKKKVKEKSTIEPRKTVSENSSTPTGGTV